MKYIFLMKEINSSFFQRLLLNSKNGYYILGALYPLLTMHG